MSEQYSAKRTTLSSRVSKLSYISLYFHVSLLCRRNNLGEKYVYRPGNGTVLYKKEVSSTHKHLKASDVVFKCSIGVSLFSDMGVFEPVADTIITVESGRAALLAFPKIESEPPPSVIWQDEIGALRYDQKYAVTNKHELVILCTSHEDEKAYRLNMLYLIYIFHCNYTRGLIM